MCSRAGGHRRREWCPGGVGERWHAPFWPVRFSVGGAPGIQELLSASELAHSEKNLLGRLLHAILELRQIRRFLLVLTLCRQHLSLDDMGKFIEAYGAS